jgi:nucleotide-binding universal stress UspA family protein
MAMRVLLATDGSTDAQAAAAWLADFPLPPDATVRVTTVAGVTPASLDIPTVRDFQASLRQEARAVADRTCARLAGRVRTLEAHVLEGDARETLVRAAEEWPADLVVVGARGLSVMAGLVLGSVSLAVARHAPCPVLVVKSGARPLRHILVAIDGSEPAQAAAEFVARLPLDPALLVQVLGVVERPRFPSAAPAAVAGHLRAAVEQLLAERMTTLGLALEQAAGAFGARAPRVERRIAVGDPTDQIVRAADTTDTDLVVVGARGLGALKRLLLGSVSEAVLRSAERSVLIVRAAG